VQRNIGYFKISVIEFFVALVILLFAIALFTLIANEIVFENDGRFDLRVSHFIDARQSPVITRIAKFVTWFGTGFFLIPAYLVVIFYLRKMKQFRKAVMVAIVAIVSLLSGWLLKDIFHRPRPIAPLVSSAGGYSFPSGHSLGGFTFSGVLIYLLLHSSVPGYLKWTISIFLILFAFLIALSRIYLRVHFASDVLGSLLVTIVWLTLTFIFLNTLEKRNER
jgi:undecaprenyl-diphosphatase